MRHTINSHGFLPNMYGQCPCDKCAAERKADSAACDAENRIYWANEERRLARMTPARDDSVGARGAW